MDETLETMLAASTDKEAKMIEKLSLEKSINKLKGANRARISRRKND